jgi:hypothetical protein
MHSFPIEYIEPVFRPPSEAKSLILPVTNGCSWNRCTFCEMYTQPQKKFRARRPEDIRRDIERAGQVLGNVRRVFLADGDAMVLPTRRLLEILADLRRAFPDLQRVSSYCLPRNLAKKTVDELRQLKAAGLEILYVGMESGDDDVLRRVNKGETAESTRSALLKIRDAGLKVHMQLLSNDEGVNGFHWQPEALQDLCAELDGLLDRYPETVISSKYYHRIITTGQMLGRRFGWSECPSVTMPLDRRDPPPRRLTNFVRWASDLKTMHRCCTSETRDCATCKDGAAHMSWVMVNKRAHMRSTQDLQNWIEVYEMFAKLYQFIPW